MLVWLPDGDLARRVGAMPGVDVEVVPDLDAAVDSASAASVEVVVLPQAVRGDPGPTLARLPALRVVQALSAGVDHLVGAVPPGVALVNARGVHTPSTAEWVCAAALACQRGLPAYSLAQQEGRWAPAAGRTLDGATVLLVGAGSIASAVEERLRPFGCRFLKTARRARPGVRAASELPALLPCADVVVVLVPLTAETAGLVDSGFLSAMKEQALLVNASRGPVVDTDALVGALRVGHVRAALDVTDPEPLPPGHALWTSPGLLLTPHVGGAVPTALSRQAEMLAERLPRWAELGGPSADEAVGDGY